MKIEIPIPKDLTLGPISKGTRLDLMTSYEVADGGRLCVVGVEGRPMPGYDSDGNLTPEPGSEYRHDQRSKFVDAYTKNRPKYGGT